jgi:hypothetical protein
MSPHTVNHLNPNAHPNARDQNKPSSPLGVSPLQSRLLSGFQLRFLDAIRTDRQALLEHWMGLDTDGLFTRFFHAPTPEALAKSVEALDMANPRFAGIFDPQERLVCVAQWADEGGGTAELAFSTLPEFRKRGLAKIASGVCAIDARERGLMRMRIDNLRINKPGRMLAQSLGGEIEASDEPFSESIISYLDLRNANKISLGLGSAHNSAPADPADTTLSPARNNSSTTPCAKSSSAP